MNKTAKVTTKANGSATGIVVYGLDEDKKPHAGRFAGDEVETARKAAEAMKLTVVDLGSEALNVVAALLPVGKLYATGKAFLPFVRPETYERLVTAVASSVQTPGPAGSASGTTATAPASTPAAASSSPALPRTWEEIRVGSLIIGHESPDDGWWEAIVTEIKGDQLTVRWRDFPRQRPIVVTRNDVAFLPVS